MKYLIDPDGFYVKETKGQISPHGQVIFPSNVVDKKPPQAVGDTSPKWDGSKWKLEIHPERQRELDKQAKEAEEAREADRAAKLAELNPDGVLMYYLDAQGEVKPKNVSQLSHDLRNNKRALYLADRYQKLELAQRYMVLALLDGNNVLANELKSYRDNLIDLGPTIKADTDMNSLVYPTMPDIGDLDKLKGEDLLA